MIYDPFQQAALHYVAERPDGGEAGDEEGGENEQDQDARSDHSSAHSKVGTGPESRRVDAAEGAGCCRGGHLRSQPHRCWLSRLCFLSSGSIRVTNLEQWCSNTAPSA
jgi:hypothetical protein